MTVTYHVGDTRDVTATIPDGSVSLIATSPPFLALRSYLPADHHAKHAEIGSEPDPATFIDTLLGLTAEWGRVLAPHGSIAIELGDTYAGHDNRGSGADAGRHDAKTASITTGPGWPRAKSLALIPQAYAASLAYGRNVLRGPMSAFDALVWVDGLRSAGMSADRALAVVGSWAAEHSDNVSPAGQWLVRNVIVWHRPNPAVGALGDKYRPSTSYIVVATRSPKRWFDLTAVRGEGSPNTHARTAKGVDARETTGKRAASDGNFDTLATQHLGAPGAPPLDCWTDPWDGEHDTWTITTQPSSLAHYAMWPAKLVERLILSMCPAEVCTACGEAKALLRGYVREFCNTSQARPESTWTDCGCGAGWTPGVTLDPFAGTGTTLAVADLHGRDAIGIDIDQRNRDLYPARREEVARSLFGTKPELPGQLDMFGGNTA